MLKAEARQSAKKEHGKQRVNVGPSTAQPERPNLLWQQLAMRVQTKLSVSAPDDPYEREADQVANQVMRMPAPAVQRSCAACSAGDTTCPPCEEEQKGGSPTIHRKAHDGENGDGTSVSDKFLAGLGSGQPLDGETRSFMEPRFGRSFEQVRIHTDRTAAESTRGVSALAYTIGQHLVFGSGQYAPQTAPGKRLLAHELTHVVQQGADLTTTATPMLQRVPDPRAQEADRAATEMWGIVGNIAELGAELEFLYFTSSGAMTLVSYKRTKPGSGAATTVSIDKFKEDTLGFKSGSAVGSTFVTFVGTGQRYFKLSLRRDASKWSMLFLGEDTTSGQPATPPEGRTQPNAASAGWPVDVALRVSTEVKKWVPILKVYPGGKGTFRGKVEFDDDRLTKFSLAQQSFDGGKGPSFAPAAPFTDLIVNNMLLAFSQGLGTRTINFTLEGEAQTDATQTKWRVAEASTDRGPAPPLPDEAAVVIADYRRMHAEIIAKWREGVKQEAIYAGMFGVEQLVFWLLGGIVAKGLGVLFEAAAPRLIGFIRIGSKGGSRAGIEYLETMIARLPIAEREEMQVLARKMETEGIDALGQAEKTSLQKLLTKIESLIEAPLTTAEKDTLRGRMVARFGAAKPGVDALFQAAKRSYQIHHRLPLEYGHLFPGLDVNAGKNLIGLETEVHRGVNAVWTKLRTTAPGGKIGGNVVSRVMDIVDKYFGKWYDVVPTTGGTTLEAEVTAAKAAAIDEVTALVGTL